VIDYGLYVYAGNALGLTLVESQTGYHHAGFSEMLGLCDDTGIFLLKLGFRVSSLKRRKRCRNHGEAARESSNTV
jgi:hypothetical protein